MSPSNPSSPAPGPWKLFSQLTKFPIASASTLTAAAGYLAAARGIHLGLVTVLLGTLLLALSSCAINEWQERLLDAQMERTAQRPIPSGRIPAGLALAIAIVLGGSGYLILLRHGWRAALLGLLALVWYNGVYTPLKRWTPFAVVPGALIGAAPPAIGWVAVGGRFDDPRMLALCLVFFLWQVPHFWLLLLRHDRDYQRAGFPTLSDRFDSAQSRRVLFVWIASVVFSCGLLPAFGVLNSYTTALLLLLPALWLMGTSLALLRQEVPASLVLKLFPVINVFVLALTLAASLDPFLHS